MLLEFTAHSDTGIDAGKLYLTPYAVIGNLLTGHLYKTFFSVIFYGIAHNILYNLSEMQWTAYKPVMHALIWIQYKYHTGFHRLRINDIRRFLQQFRHIEQSVFQFDLARFQFIHIQHIIYQIQ